MRDADELADAVVLIVKSAMSPVLERLAATEARLAMVQAVADGVTSLRDRLVVLETKNASEVVSEVCDRVAVLEARPSLTDTVDAVHGLVSRVSVLEQSAGDRVSVKDFGDVRERLAVVEARSPVPGPAGKDGRDGSDAPIGDLAKDVGALRERVAVAEVRPLLPGPSGPAGKDGADGLGFDDLTIEQQDERSFTVKAIRGDRVKDIGTVRFPVQIQRGVYVTGKSYEPGDVVTWAGSQWHCNETTSAKPGDGSKAWTLVVKRGNDGKDLRDTVPTPPMPVVSVGGRS